MNKWCSLFVVKTIKKILALGISDFTRRDVRDNLSLENIICTN